MTPTEQTALVAEMRDLLELLTLDRAGDGRPFKGNSDLPGDAGEFYLGYNAGIKVAFEHTSGIARRMLPKVERYLIEQSELCPHGLADGVNCRVCDTDGAAESQGYLTEHAEPTSTCRWEVGLRNIVTILAGPRVEFEIADIVEKVRNLKEAQQDRPTDGEVQARSPDVGDWSMPAVPGGRAV